MASALMTAHSHATVTLCTLTCTNTGPALTIEERFEERFSFKMNFYRVLEWRMRRWVSEGKAVVVVG